LKVIGVLVVLSLVLQGPLACYCIGSPPSPQGAAPFDIVVVDPDEAPASLVAELREAGKTVIAYINVGYAEEWRWYWDRAVAAGIVHESTEYEGEYYVEYWSPAWHEIIIEYVEMALSMGFDGVYLDNIDASLILAETGPSWAVSVDTMGEMIRLVGEVSRASPIVYVNIGGAVHLLYNDTLLASIDGVLREEVFRYIEGPGRLTPVPLEESMTVLEALEHARSRGVTVMVVEYVHTPIDAAYYYTIYRLLGFIPILQPDTDPDYMKPPWVPSWVLGGSEW